MKKNKKINHDHHITFGRTPIFLCSSVQDHLTEVQNKAAAINNEFAYHSLCAAVRL